MKRIAAPNALGVLLIKPQFEVGRTRTVEGLVKDPKIRQEAIDRVTQSLSLVGVKLSDMYARRLLEPKKETLRNWCVYIFRAKETS